MIFVAMSINKPYNIIIMNYPTRTLGGMEGVASYG